MKSEKQKISESDLIGLLALKAYERPNEDRVEKNIQNIMRAVRNTDNAPASILLFPEKGFSWILERPRYGIAALFILFLGMHLINRPLNALHENPTLSIEKPEPINDAMAVLTATAIATNQPQATTNIFNIRRPVATSVPSMLTSFEE